MRFTTNAFPRESRLDAWRFALKRHAITLDATGVTDEVLYGELAAAKSELGIDLLVLTATPQQLTVDYSEHRDCFWLAMLLDGSASAHSGKDSLLLADGDIAYGRSNLVTQFDFPDDVHLLVVRLPASLMNVRLRAPLPDRIGRLSGDGAAARILSGMLRAVAATVPDVTGDQLRPVELGLPEFLIAAILHDAPARALGGAAGMRAALLERIFQTIEMRLSDPDLNLQQVASEHGVSPRYLQKLFETVDDSFGHYVKLRRLERCRLDLRSPLHAQKSISDILFQWGFNDSASFSRAFREQYGLSPREFRKAPPADAAATPLHRGRPPQRREGRVRPDAAADDLLAADPTDDPKGAAPSPADAASADGDLDADRQSPVVPGIRHHLLPVSPTRSTGAISVAT